MRDARRAAVLVALLALVMWWTAPAPPVVTHTVSAPPVVADAACAQLREPAEQAGTDTGRGPAAPEAPPTLIPCPIPSAVAELQPPATIHLEGPDGSLFEEGRYEGRVLLVPQRPGYFTGSLYLPGFTTASLTFWDGVCRVGPIHAKATVSGLITPRDGADEGAIAVQGCGANVTVDADGGFFAEVEPTACTLFAVRRDGALVVRSEPVDLDLRPGDEVIVDLRLPAWRAADVGAELTQDDAGAIVVRASHGELRPGDRVLAIDGAPLDDASLWEAHDLAVGPDGTDVVYEIDRDGEVLTLTLRRAVPDDDAP
jgi:hypothetical protein